MQFIYCLLVLCMVAAVHCNVQCKSDIDCDQDECCAFVMGKYGSTACLGRGKPQSTCRPHAKPANFTVSDPGGVSIPVSNVHYMVCPCSDGLYCGAQGSCEYGLPMGSESHPAQMPRPY